VCENLATWLAYLAGRHGFLVVGQAHISFNPSSLKFMRRYFSSSATIISANWPETMFVQLAVMEPSFLAS